ncbi:hypothetical protein H0H92_004332, partial [Tricholoma furcatifolium]
MKFLCYCTVNQHTVDLSPTLQAGKVVFLSSVDSALREMEFTDHSDKHGSPTSPEVTLNHISGYHSNETKVTTAKHNEDPKAGEYIGVIVKEALSTLSTVANILPVPGLGPAVRLAINIIQAYDDGRATFNRADELRHRIKSLVDVLFDRLNGKTLDDIDDGLKKSIEMLHKDMEYIQMTLDSIASKGTFKLVMFRSLHEDQMIRQVEHTIALTQVKQGVTALQDASEKTQHNMNKVMSMLVDGPSEAVGASEAPPYRTRAAIPSNTLIFHGRDVIVSEVVCMLTEAHRRHVCLLGPGGMGKTSTSLAVMAHPEVKARYADHLRIWIPCVNATSLALLLDTLMSSLAIRTKGDPLAAILSELNTSRQPTIILLDNFETPWDSDDQSDVENVLREIHSIYTVTMLVTMRSSMPPCDDLPWHSVNLRAVDADAARSIYTSRHARGATDPDLPHLMEVIGNMPLAIILTAKVAKMTGLSAVKLIEEYKRSGTSIMGRGSDAKSSMDVCIGLSVNSPRMKAHPEAFHLLCIISMLPTGASYEMLSQWWAKELAVLMGALEVLLETSLVEQSDLKYSVLPVIQSYVRHSSRFLDKTVRDMIDVACAFLNEHSSVVEDPLYKSNSATLRIEDSNLTHILLHLATPVPDLIRDGHLALARHQQHHRPRSDIVEHAMKLT